MINIRVIERLGMVVDIMVQGLRRELQSRVMSKKALMLEIKDAKRAGLVEIAHKRANQNQDLAIIWALHSFKMLLKMMQIV